MQSLSALLQRRIDARPIAIARIVVGIAAIMKMVDTAGALLGFLSRDYAVIPYQIRSPIPRDEMAAEVLLALWTMFAFMYLLGYYTSLAGVGLAVTILAVITIDQQLYSNHLYLLVFVVILLTIADSGARYSLDARQHGGREHIAAWPTILLKLQLTSVYFFAAATKLNQGFLDGTVFREAFEPTLLSYTERLVPLQLLAISAIVLELFLAIAFWSRRARWVALPVALGFHGMNVIIIGHGAVLALGAFGVIMGGMIMLFFADAIERVLVRRK